MTGAALIRAVLFDAVGTLIAPSEAVGETYARIARSHGVDLPAARLQDAFERILEQMAPDVVAGESLAQAAERERAWWRELVRRTFRAADATARFDDFEACFGSLFRHYAQPSAWRLLPGVRTGLQELTGRGLDLAIVSNGDQRLRAVLQGLGIHDEFRAVVLPAEAGAAKPERAIFDVCLKRLGLPAFRCVYVGDHARVDVAAARAHGMRAVDVGDLATLAELPKHIEELQEAPA